MKFLQLTLLSCLLTATLYPEQNAQSFNTNTTPINIEANDNNPGVTLIRDIQETLLTFIKNVINQSYNNDDSDYDYTSEYYRENFLLIHSAFEDFYGYIIQLKAKPKIHVLIMFFEFCKPIFKHSPIADLIAQQSDTTRELIFENFVMAWQAMFENELEEMQDELEAIITDDFDNSEFNNTQNVSLTSHEIK